MKITYKCVISSLFVHFAINILLAIFIFLRLFHPWTELGYLIYSIIAIVLLFKIYKQNLKENFKKEVTEVFFIALFFGFIMYGTQFCSISSNTIMLNLPYNTYIFEIRLNPENNIVFNSMSLFYDFRSYDGNLSFNIRQINESIITQYIHINFPSELNLTEIKLTKGNKLLTEGVDYNLDLNNTVIEGTNLSLDDTNVAINFSGKMLPNGDFHFYSFANRTYTLNNLFTFYLGDYECKDNCFGNTVLQMQSEFKPAGNTLLINPNNYDVSPLQQFFYLNTYYTPDKQTKDRYEALYIGLIIAFFTLIIEFALKFFGLFLYFYRFDGRFTKRY